MDMLTLDEAIAATPPAPPALAFENHATPDGMAQPCIAPAHLLDVGTLYVEPTVEQYPHGREILARFPDVPRIPIASHWKIPELHRDRALASRWLDIKKTVLVLGTRKGVAPRENGRSADFIGPSFSNGCAMACAYCYVPRRKGFTNPISLFVNTDQIVGAIERHARRLGPKTTPNQVDPACWVYDVGENGDVSVDAYLHPGVRELVERFARLPNAKASFATKHVNRMLLDWDPQEKTRVRFGLMPQHMAAKVDVRADPIAKRIAAIGDFVDAGYEVHINLSPVILYEGWEADYDRLLQEVADVVPERAKRQLKAEIIMLTHHTGLHEINLEWHPKGEEALWRPEQQQLKRSQSGGWNLRYRNDVKAAGLAKVIELLARRLPECEVRYAF